jgi:hypothetical protein
MRLIESFKSSPKYIKIITFSLIFLVLFSLLLLAVGEEPEEEISPTQTTPSPTETPPISLPVSNAQTSDQCAAEGGDWQAWGSEGREFCQIPAKDAGKSCTDGSQCTYGVCRSTEETTSGKGVCAKHPAEFGCYKVIEKGQIVNELCVD